MQVCTWHGMFEYVSHATGECLKAPPPLHTHGAHYGACTKLAFCALKALKRQLWAHTSPPSPCYLNLHPPPPSSALLEVLLNHVRALRKEKLAAKASQAAHEQSVAND